MLRKPAETVVQIGSLTAMKTAVPGTGRLETIASAPANGNGHGSNGNGHSNGNSNGTAKPAEAEMAHASGD